MRIGRSHDVSEYFRGCRDLGGSFGRIPFDIVLPLLRLVLVPGVVVDFEKRPYACRSVID